MIRNVFREAQMNELRTQIGEDYFPLPKLSDREFNLFCEMILEECGIKITEKKRVLLQNRIGKRLRALRCPTFKEYYQYVKTAKGRRAELDLLWSAVTTNETHFFREPHHLESLGKSILPEVEARKTVNKTVRIWSAGCSTGQEPYTIAAVLKAYFDKKPGWRFSVTATDIDVNALATAKKAEYPLNLKKEIPPQYLLRYFSVERGVLSPTQEIKGVVNFAQKNLRHLAGWRTKFDIIFCRNVIMYFDMKFRASLVQDFHRLLLNEGILIVGSSESLHGMPRLFSMEKTGKTLIYRRLADSEVRSEQRVII